MSQHKLDWMK
jgi:hypothetical protein